MLRKLLVFVFALSALNATANTITAVDPIEDYLALEIDKLELELELFGEQANGEEAISILAIDIYDLNETVEIGFDTSNYLPADFNAKEGMNELDWDMIKLYEIEEEIELDFETTNYLPKDFKFAKKLVCDGLASVELDN